MWETTPGVWTLESGQNWVNWHTWAVTAGEEMWWMCPLLLLFLMIAHVWISCFFVEASFLPPPNFFFLTSSVLMLESTNLCLPPLLNLLRLGVETVPLFVLCPSKLPLMLLMMCQASFPSFILYAWLYASLYSIPTLGCRCLFPIARLLSRLWL